MKRIFFVALATLSLTTPAFAAAKKAQALTTKKAAAKPHADFHFLPFWAVAKLDFNSRVKYVKTFRALLVEGETAQNVFHNSVFADLTAPYEKQNEFYALLFGSEAYARQSACPSDDGGRGSNATDICISGYGDSHYLRQTDGSQQPFMCVQNSCPNKDNKPGGVLCDYYLSGIPSDMTEACVDADVRSKSTVICEGIRNRLSTEHSKDVQHALDEAHAIFDFSNAPANQKKPLTYAQLAGTEDIDTPQGKINVKTALSDLFTTAYSDQSFAELVTVISLYKKNGRELPISGLDGFTSKIDPSKFENDFNAAQTALKQVFSGYIGHCEHALTKCVTDQLKNPSWAASVAQAGQTVQEMENRRIRALGALQAGEPATVENVLEIDECITLKDRYAKLKQQLDNAASTLPNIGGGPVPQPVPVTPAPTKSQDLTQATSTGCRDNVGRAENHLLHPASRCMVCLAERAMEKAGDKYTDPKERDYHHEYTASSKWFSLLSTMVIACGDGTGGNHAIQPEVMTCYMEAFGHCSNDDYAWDPAGRNDRVDGFDGDPNDISECDNWLADQWADTSYWDKLKDPAAQQKYADRYQSHGCGNIKKKGMHKMEKGKLAAPDTNNDFVRVYGISYDEATKIFCDKDKFDRTFWRNKIKDEKPLPPMHQCTAAWIAQARQRMKQSHEITNGKYNPAAQGLDRCLSDSLKNANELYSGGDNYCVNTQTVSSGDDAHFRLMMKQASEGTPNFLGDTGNCYISKQYDFYPTTDGNREAVSYVDPKYARAASDPNQPTQDDIDAATRYTRAFIPGADHGEELAFPGYGVCAQNGCRPVAPLDPSSYQYFRYSYQDSNACTVPRDSSVRPSEPVAH